MNDWQRPSKLGYSYEDVRSMDDQRLIKVGIDSGDRLATELANRLDLALERTLVESTNQLDRILDGAAQ